MHTHWRTAPAKRPISSACRRNENDSDKTTLYKVNVDYKISKNNLVSMHDKFANV